MAAQNQGDLFDAYFKRADLDGDGRISGQEAVAFFQGSNLTKQVLAQIWTYADQNRTGFLGRAEFYNALKLVTVAQSKRELTPELVRAALFGPASAKIPAPQISLPAAPVPQSSGVGATPPASLGSNVAPIVSQNPGPRAVSVLPNVNPVQQHNQSILSGFVRPQNTVSGITSQSVQVGFQGFQGGAPPLGSNLPSSGSLNDPGAANFGRPPIEGGVGHLTNQSGVPSSAVPVSSLPPRPFTPPVSQNGFPQPSFPGNGAVVAAPAQPRKDGFMPPSNVGSVQVSSGVVPVSGGNQSSINQGSVPAVTNHSVSGLHQKVQGQLKSNQQIPVPAGRPASSPNTSTGHQSQLHWPRPSQTDLQKYTKVFMEVDTDKDGKITGHQARNLFLSWRLPREVLKQVWDLSDQDNDSMLSLREFCIALYLMERYREGRPLPAVLPNSVLLDFPATVQPAVGRPSATWGYSAGFQQPQATPGTAPRPTSRPAGKPPLPVHPSSDDRMPPKPPKAKVPTLEKHLVDQLSEEEQKSLNLKFQEATEANKKVEELEKEIKESREKMDLYQAKMQELVLYKSRCDSRLNEVSERAAADKHEVESLAKKYEEKYRHAGGVASKLTIEEATFRDIQEKKMEMYQAISKIEQGGNDDLQVCADHIQSSLEELVKSLSERCKKYGLRSKPTTLVELPFGWQPGIQESAADWAEDWDKFEDEGYTFVKEMTLDVQNVIAPPKTKVKVAKKERYLAAEGEATSLTAEADTESISVKTATEDKQVSQNGVIGTPKVDDGSKDNLFKKSGHSDASPHAKESHSELGIADASVSGEKSFDEPSQGTFDTTDDADSVWDPSKEIDCHKHIDDLFGHGNWTLPPIKTSSSNTDDFLPPKGIFADSVPGTPADSFLPKKSLFTDSVPGTPADSFLPQKSFFADSVPGTPAEGFLPKQSIFADSVPSTPLHGSSYSPQKYGEGTERGFNFSRFDSFRSSDSGFQPQEKLSRFDSMHSTGDFDSQDDRPFQQGDAFTRFDSMRSTNNDFDYGDRFSSFDDSDPFGSGHYKSSFGNETPRRDSDAFGSSAFRSSFGNETPRRDSDAFGLSAFRSSFGNETPRLEVDGFGSGGPFKSSSMTNETPRADSDPYGSSAPFRSSFGGETPRADADPFGSVGPFKSSWGNETPRSEADPFGGPFRSSLGSETPRRESDYFGYSGSFKSSFGNETPRSEFDSYGFGGPFGSSLGSETPRGDFDTFGSSGPFKSTVSGETPKGRTDSWSAF